MPGPTDAGPAPGDGGRSAAVRPATSRQEGRVSGSPVRLRHALNAFAETPREALEEADRFYDEATVRLVSAPRAGSRGRRSAHRGPARGRHRPATIQSRPCRPGAVADTATADAPGPVTAAVITGTTASRPGVNGGSTRGPDPAIAWPARTDMRLGPALSTAGASAVSAMPACCGPAPSRTGRSTGR